MQNSARMRLSQGEIHLWSVDLDATGRPEVLSADERARAERFHFARARDRYVNGRSALRVLLAKYLAILPQEVIFTYSPSAKPLLPNSPVSFNLAHSENHALVAITENARVGIDIEVPRFLEDLTSVAEFSFSEGEFRRWRNLKEVGSFYRCWTRKEAYLKATGDGIAQRLKTFEVSFEPADSPAILSGAEGTWTLLDVSREPSYIAAIACEGISPKLEEFSFSALL